MSDIIRNARRFNPRARRQAQAAARALEWLERYIRSHGLGKGDALPGELAMARAVGLGRSSVREALTALKTLGMIRSRRKGGIRLVRDPALLELRHYFAERFATRARYADAMEFRAALEWGLGPLILAHMNPATLRALRRVVQGIKTGQTSNARMIEAEIKFHTILTSVCANRLAALFGRLYEPMFHSEAMANLTARSAVWLRNHTRLIEALASRDMARFMSALRHHTHGYMRLPGGK